MARIPYLGISIALFDVGWLLLAERGVIPVTTKEPAWCVPLRQTDLSLPLDIRAGCRIAADRRRWATCSLCFRICHGRDTASSTASYAIQNWSRPDRCRRRGGDPDVCVPIGRPGTLEPGAGHRHRFPSD